MTRTRFLLVLALLLAAALPALCGGIHPPSNLKVTGVTSSSISLSWTNRANSYDNVYVERANSGTGPWSVIATLAFGTSTYIDSGSGSGLLPATLYYYRARAKSGNSYSSYSNTVSGKTSGAQLLLAPTSLMASAVSTSQINLTWVDNSSNEGGFYVERSLDGLVFVQIAQVGANVTSYNDSGLSPGTTYYYRVRAFAGSTTSGYTNTSSATTTAPSPPAAPSGLAATAISTSEIDLSWTDNASDEDGFKVERSPDNSTWSVIATLGVNVTACKDTGLSADTLYYYRVRAYKGSLYSSYSNTASATTLTVTTGATYYVATTGNDSTGTGSSGSPWRTITKGLATMAGGDTLIVKVGTYTEASTLQPKSGVSWDQPTTIKADTGATVTVKVSSGSYLMYFYGGVSYVSVEHLILDGSGGNTNSVVVMTDDSTTHLAPAHIRLSSCEVENSKNQGIQTFLNASGLTPTSKCCQDIRIIGGSVHDNGDGIFNGVMDSTHEHGIYCQFSNSLIDGVEVYNNVALGIQMYEQAVVNSGGVSAVWCSNNTIRNCYVHDNGRLAGVTSGSTGILISCGTGNKAYNNLCVHQSAGVSVDFYANQTGVYNNTCYNNRTNFRAGNNTVVTNATFTNNVAWRPTSSPNTTNNFTSFSGSTFTLTTNLNLTSGTSGTDPLFVDSANGDFHLQSMSPAIDVGSDLTSLGVTTDLEGTARPQGSGFDEGSFEFH